MAKFRNKYRIEPNRWGYWDYSTMGQYFLTAIIRNRKHILGEIKNGIMVLSSAGEIVKSEIENIPTYHQRIILDEWVIMPNHIHLIVELAQDKYDNRMATTTNANNKINQNQNNVSDEKNDVKKIHEFSLQNPINTPILHQWWKYYNYEPDENDIKQYRKHRRKMLIPKIMGKMKMITSKHINMLNQTPGNKNWHNNYRDHQTYYTIKNYIINNPKNWNEDKFYCP